MSNPNPNTPIQASGGRTGANPCLSPECSLEDRDAWREALVAYYGEAVEALKKANERAAKSGVWSQSAAKAEAALSEVNKFLGFTLDMYNSSFVSLHMFQCRVCVEARDALLRYASPARSGGGGGVLLLVIPGIAAVVGALILSRR